VINVLDRHDHQGAIIDTLVTTGCHSNANRSAVNNTTVLSPRRAIHHTSTCSCAGHRLTYFALQDLEDTRKVDSVLTNFKEERNLTDKLFWRILDRGIFYFYEAMKLGLDKSSRMEQNS